MYTGLESEANRREVWAASVGEADLLAGYTVRKMSKGRQMSFQLNIYNVFDETDPIITRYGFTTGEARPVGVKPRDPLRWRFTTNVEF
jgi:outer membrane receptor protein involved in Fe transport